MITTDYITAIRVKLLTTSIIQSFNIIKERAILDQGYIRIRLTLQNGDFCELVEFFQIENQTCMTKTYRYQWMDSTQKQLRKRWDNVEHFPNLPNFPHHVHISQENNVHPSHPRNILEIIDQIAQELSEHQPKTP